MQKHLREKQAAMQIDLPPFYGPGAMLVNQ